MQTKLKHMPLNMYSRGNMCGWSNPPTGPFTQNTKKPLPEEQTEMKFEPSWDDWHNRNGIESKA